jgi:hypothetical protein
VADKNDIDNIHIDIDVISCFNGQCFAVEWSADASERRYAPWQKMGGMADSRATRETIFQS